VNFGNAAFPGFPYREFQGFAVFLPGFAPVLHGFSLWPVSAARAGIFRVLKTKGFPVQASGARGAFRQDFPKITFGGRMPQRKDA